MKCKPHPTQAELIELFDYCEETGNLIWRHNPNRNRSWNARYAGRVAGFVCVGKMATWKIAINGSGYCAHRLVWIRANGPIPDGLLIDHINPSDRFDNRLSNLRLATLSQNLANTRPHRDNLSGFKGVSRDKRKKKWAAAITGPGGRSMRLGYFDTPEQANAAYAKAAREIYGEFARWS